MRFHRIAVTVAAALLGAAATAAPAGAVAGVPKAVEVSANTVLQGLAGKAAAPGCYGQTDRPHNSTHEPGSINVVARTVCPGFGAHVSTNLYRSRWWGWEQRGSGTNNGVNNVQTNAAESVGDCDGTHDYLGASYHEASDAAWARTSNRANKLTC
jgi:hypothetical protein